MTRSLTDRIEQYIKTLIERSETKQIEIQRMELAETFACVPSQVTYVVATRFGPQSGYLAESRRGGSGYMRIRKLDFYVLPPQEEDEMAWLWDLCRQKQLTEREAALGLCFYRQAFEPLNLTGEQKQRLFRKGIQQFLDMMQEE